MATKKQLEGVLLAVAALAEHQAAAQGSLTKLNGVWADLISAGPSPGDELELAWGGPHHVETAKGAQLYHLPVGSVIVPHPHLPTPEGSWIPEAKWKAGEADWVSDAEAIWKAHEWKDPDSGHRFIYGANGHAYLAPGNAKVWVPKHTDLSNGTELANAPKHITLGEPGNGVRHTISEAGEAQEGTPYSQGAHEALQADWKEIPHGEQKVPVAHGSKLTGWIPESWKLYHSAQDPDKGSKVAKDPQGNWHIISKAFGVKPASPGEQGIVSNLVKNGDYVLAGHQHAPQEPQHTPAPPEASEGSQPAKVSVGGIDVTKDEIHQAIEILNNDKSTAVKQPLKKAAHPLWQMDYHGVSKAQLAAHPELKVPKGSKQEHVGQVKLAVLHHLSAQADKLAADEAQQQIAKEAGKAAEDAAEHAQKLTPGVHEFPGSGGVHVEVTAQQIQAVVTALEGTKSTAIAQTLKAKAAEVGIQFQFVDYWAVVTKYKESHPGDQGLKAKAAFIAALSEALAATSQQDAESGHTEASKLHGLVTGKTAQKLYAEYQANAQQAADGYVTDLPEKQVAIALAEAASSGKAVYVTYSPFAIMASKSWVVSHGPPAAVHLVNGYYSVSPAHAILWHHSAAPAGTPISEEQLAEVTKYLEQQPPAAPSAAEPDLAAWKASPGYKTLHELVTQAHSATVLQAVKKAGKTWDAMVAFALMMSVKVGNPRWLITANGSEWEVVSSAPVTGVPGSSAHPFFKVTPDYQVLKYADDGTFLTAYTGGSIMAAEKYLLPEAPSAPEPEPFDIEHGPGIAVMAGGDIAGYAPEGSTVYIIKNSADPLYGVKYALWPDVTWHAYSQMAVTSVDAHKAALWIKNGEIVLLADYEQTPPPSVKTPASAEPEKQVQFTHAGYTYNALPGATLFKSAGALATKANVWALLPDGTWQRGKFGSWEHVTALAQQEFEKWVATGEIAEFTPGIGEKPVAPSAPEATGAPISVLSKDKLQVLGEVPAGSKFYSGYQDTVYVKTPDGTWWQTYGSKIIKVPDYALGSVKNNIADGSYKETPAPTPEEAKHAQEVAALKALLRTAAGVPKGKTWQQSLAASLANRSTGAPNQGTYYTVQVSGGLWTSYQSYNVPSAEWYSINMNTLEVQHQNADGTQEFIPFADLQAAVAQYVTPEAVHLGNKVYKKGFYYKPKGKAYLEIKPFLGSAHGLHSAHKHGNAAAKATFIYHAMDGSAKQVSVAYATKALESTEWFADPKPAGAAPTAAKPLVLSYATAYGPGIYAVYDGGTLDVKSDGSAIHTAQHGHAVSVAPSLADQLLAKGQILDSFGTTVVKPGVKPSGYHIFGHFLDAATLKALAEKVEQSYSNPKEIKAALLAVIPGISSGATNLNLKKFSAAKIAGELTWEGQRDALLALFKELLAVSAGADIAEPSFLKGLPPGIHGPKDVFSFNGQGQAKPFGGDIGAHNGDGNFNFSVIGYTSPELSELIKEISAEFGGGKVVGTHPASMSKDAKLAWLAAWQAGDMASVFTLDAASGKVSPVHPGAPDNQAFHQVTWAPWGAGETPATQVVDGEWSDPAKVTLPKAEVANYLIKAGLKHPEYLTAAERRQWVVQHRAHNQQGVNWLSRLAWQRSNDGLPVLSEPPVWTDNIKPAKSYDTYLEDKTPAKNWSPSALIDFLQDYSTDPEIATAVAWFNQQTGYAYTPADIATGAGFTQHRQVVQHYLATKEQQEIAEQSIPVWSVKEGGASPTSSHPIYEVSRLVPYTGDKSSWLFKPAPSSEKFLAEQEDAAAKLGAAWGFRTPRSELVEINGSYGQAQLKLAPDGDLEYGAKLGFYTVAPIPWQNLTAQQLSDIAREHVLDWALDNDDGRASNFLRMPDGSVVGLDKGRSWAKFGHWQGLSGTEAADERSAQVITSLYNAIRAHAIPKDVADEIYKAVIQRARRMERLSDDRMQGILEGAFANRPGYPGQFNSRAKLIQAIIDRKNSLAADFEKLWQSVYAGAAYGQLPDVPLEKLPQLKDGTPLHSGFTEPEFAEHVVANHSFGTPAFFSGTELEGAHVLVWSEYAGEKTHLVKGEARAVGAAYKKIVSWAKAHQTHGTYNNPVTPVPKDNSAVKGEQQWYDAIISAAKTVSYHVSDKNFNTAKLQGMADVETKLSKLLIEAEELLNAGELGLSSASKIAQFKITYGAPILVKDAAQYYLGLIDKVQEAQDNGTIFQPGDLPQWKAPAALLAAEGKTPEPEPEPSKGVTVELKPATRALADTHDKLGYPHVFNADGELHTSLQSYTYDGQAWHVTLPTGEVIELSDGPESGVNKAHYGRIRFTLPAEDSLAGLERVRAQLQQMGLAMDDAEEHDLELHYWRHLAGILATRADVEQGKHAEVWAALANGMSGLKLPWVTSKTDNIAALAAAGVAPDQELALWRKAWASLTSADQMDKFLAAQGYLPQLGHFDTKNPGARGGKPYWLRFDVTSQWLLKQKLVAHAFTSNADTSTVRVIRSGGLFSTEGRLRALGSWVTGMSSTTDMSHGSSGFVFTRLHQPFSGAQVLINPLVLARTETYGWNEDKYGNTDYLASSAYFDLEKAAKWNASGNETMVPDAISFLDEIEIIKAYTDEQRQMIIQELKDEGITHIRGIPVEQRIVTQLTEAEVKLLMAEMATNVNEILW